MDSIEPSTKSLHNRRSILIKDVYEQVIWIIQGSAAADSTKQSGVMSAKKMNAELGFQFDILEKDYEDAEDFIQSLLDRKEEVPKIKQPKKQPAPKKAETSPPQTRGVRKTISKASIPKVPKIEAKGQAIRPKGDQDVSQGPEIKEFQISYYHDDEEDTQHAEVSIGEAIPARELLLLIRDYVDQVDEIVAANPTRKTASEALNRISKQIIDLLYT